MAHFKFFGTSGTGGGGDTNTNIANDNLTFDGDHNTGNDGNSFTWFDTDIDVDRFIKLVGAGGSSEVQIGLTDATHYKLPNGRGTKGQALMFSDDSGTLGFKNVFATSPLADDTNTGLGTDCGVDLLATAERNTMMGNGCLEIATEIEDMVAIGNGAMALQLTGIKSTAVGSFAMAQATGDETGVAIGYRTAQSITTNGKIVAIGQQALEDNTAEGSTAIGHKAMLQNSNAVQCTAVGFEALREGNGTGNTAVGFQSQQVVTTSRFNTSLGAGTLELLTGALGSNGNTAIGFGAMSDSVSCQLNTCVGNLAGANLGDTALGGGGDDNTCLGANAGDSITTGSDNIIIGSASDSGTASEGTIVIGKGEVATGDNELHFGSASVNCTTIEAGTFTADKVFTLFLNGTEYRIACEEV